MPQRSAIVDWDYEDTVAPYDFPAVVMVGGSCTGTLITPNHVLTAGHCAHIDAPGGVTLIAREGDATPAHAIRVAQCFLNPAFTAHFATQLRPVYPSLAAAGERCGVVADRRDPRLPVAAQAQDFAILQLERPVPHPLAAPATASAGSVFAAPHVVTTDPPARGDELSGVAVGFGLDETGSGGVRRVKALTLTMGDGLIDGAPVRIGDSGGPVFRVRADGSLDLVGVASTEQHYAALDRSAIRAWIASRIDAEADGRADTYCPYPVTSRGAHPRASGTSDGDGDGYLDAEDSCPGTYNPCQLTTDVDGDGTADDCDGCPGRADIAAQRGTLADTDGDRIPDVCDCDDGFFDADSDRDFIVEVCDTCRTVANTLQEDRDEDGLGDACDGCPDDADFGADVDMDGVPDACDNCDREANTLQLDCNLDAELATWAVECPPDPGGAPSCPRSDFVLGDACDPTPCGETRVATETVGARGAEELVQNALRVDARASAPREGRTGFRFCRCSFATRDSEPVRQACLALEEIPQPGGPPVTLGDCQLIDTEAYDLAEEPRNWRWTTVDYADDPARPAGPRTRGGLRVEHGSLTYDPVLDGGASFATDLWAAWDLRDADVPRWRVAFTEPIESGTLPGVLWTHTPGPPSGGDATAWDRPLASHFWAGRGRTSTEPPIPTRAPFPCIQSIVPRIGGGGFWPIPTPWIGLAGTFCPPLIDPRIVLRNGPFVYERQPGFDPPWLAYFEAPDTRWVAAAEPDGWLPAEDLRYAGLGAGLALTHLLIERGDELDDLLAQDPCAPGQCQAQPVASIARASASPPDPLVVLSARRRTLWSIEGASSRVSALDLGARVWRELPPLGPALGRVLAATYAPHEDVLYAIDEVPVRGRHLEARLVRVAVGEHARVEILGRWPRATAHHRLAHAFVASSRLYLASAHSRGPISVVARLAPDRRGRWSADGLLVRLGRFVPEGLRASEHGLTLVLDDPREGALPVAIGFDELRPLGGGIGRCL